MLVVAAIVVVRRFHLFDRGEATPVAVDDVVKRFQESSSTVPDGSPPPSPSPSSPPSTSATPSTVGTTAAATAPNAGALPVAGVYVYATTGRDSVDALNGDHHDYPATTTITVTPDGCGVQQRWDVLVERWSSWTRCAVAGGISETARQDFDRFFGQDQLDAYTCTGEPRPLDAPVGTTWTFTCSQDGDVHTLTGTVVGHEPRAVGAVDVDTLHVRVSIDSGDAGDSQVTDTWYLAGSDLIVVQRAANATTNPSPIGDVHYREDYEISLTSLTPLT